jgi:hypothetical protein
MDFLEAGSNKASVYIDKFQCRILGRVFNGLDYD